MKTLSIINPHAAAIDVGSEQLHLSIAGDEPVVFGTVTNEVFRLRDYLKAQGVTTVAMEATGVYWLGCVEEFVGNGVKRTARLRPQSGAS
jgi:hypothetical protein